MLHHLSFGIAVILKPDIAEIVIDEGVEMDKTYMTELFSWVSEYLSSPCMLLMNKINSYSYKFDAQRMLHTKGQVRAVAVVAYDKKAKHAAQFLADLPRNSKWNMKIFQDRSSAVEWLKGQREFLKMKDSVM